MVTPFEPQCSFLYRIVTGLGIPVIDNIWPRVGTIEKLLSSSSSLLLVPRLHAGLRKSEQMQRSTVSK